MSARQSPGLEGLFGYSIVDGNDAQHKPNSRQPTGPPLLDDAQSDLLHNFFQNPDDVDPAFLSHNDFSTPSEGMLNNPQGFAGWMFNGNSSHDAPPSSAQPAPAQYAALSHPQPRTASHEFGHSGPMTPSDDVWAAAQMLHGQNGHNQIHSTGQFSGSRPDSEAYGQQHQQSQGFDYPAGAQQSPTSFSFNQQGVPNGGFTPANMRHQPTTQGGRTNVVISQFGPALQGPKSRPAPPLKFGSDAHFRSDSFKAPNRFEPPDQAFRETINHNFRHAENNPLGMNPLSAGSDSQDLSPARKRRGPQAKVGAQEQERQIAVKQSSEQDEEPSAKRRKSKNIKRESPADKGKQTGAVGKSTPHETSSNQSGTKGPKHSPTAAAASTPHARPSMSTAVVSTPSAAAAGGDEQRPLRENLTEEQKRTNHIQSEQKRRNLIKQGFDDLNRMVPELRSGGFSKSNVLVEVAKFMRLLAEGNAALRDKLASLDNG